MPFKLFLEINVFASDRLKKGNPHIKYLLTMDATCSSCDQLLAHGNFLNSNVLYVIRAPTYIYLDIHNSFCTVTICSEELKMVLTRIITPQSVITQVFEKIFREMDSRKCA
jgi:hypothetical protein